MNISNKIAYSNINPYNTHITKDIKNPPIDKNHNDKLENLTKPNKVENNSSLSDKVFEDIQAMAQQDAKNNDFMSKKYQNYIDRQTNGVHKSEKAQLMAMFRPMLMQAKFSHTNNFSFNNIPGFPSFTATMRTGFGQSPYLSIFDGHGDKTLTYNSFDGWKSFPSKEDIAFQKEAHKVYAETYQKARKEINSTKYNNILNKPVHEYKNPNARLNNRT